jgi:catechol 2,3-dioxygenase-like lactoylglutathione lyase family enzyme
MIPREGSFSTVPREPVQITKLDHVALWVTERDAIASEAVARLGMHVIDRTDAFTLVGADARRGKLTLFAAEGPRERGALSHVALRVSSLDGRPAELELPDGLSVRLAEARTEVEFDLDHVALFSRDPLATAEAYLGLGFAAAEPAAAGAPRVEVGGAHIEFLPGEPGEPDRPLLNHIAVLCASADEQLQEARARGLEIADVVDAPNTKAVFVQGPEGVKIEYVEHKPTFSLV